ncbi:hypothetical protein MATL_G00095070 [Megalops atlanticus]|uniref:Uncharacterized protein n=1 Tax=Megalops atlanticus TaxID=7932 RepID=A0A9D3Q0Q6_MEGAT|nr:hypothetical protein MATL_G00095070 [Megalops atlanticus]
MMMSSNQTQSFVDLRTVGTALPVGLPKSGDLSRYIHEEPVNFSGSYFSYCLSGKEGSDLPPHWSSSGTCLQSGKSSIAHPPGAGRSLPNQLAHKPENTARCVERGSPQAAQNLTANQKPAHYDRVPEELSPSMSGIHAPPAVRKFAVGGAGLSPQTESPVALAIPRPIYGHSPCCTEHGCTSGPCYGVERGLPRIHPNAYEEEWMLHYGHLSLLQRKEREALLQQRLLQLEQNGVRFPLRENRPEGYHAMRPAGPLRLPLYADTNYSGFPYASPTRLPVSSPSDLFHRLQIPSKVHQGLPPSPSCSYEEMQHMPLPHPVIPPRTYPDCPPMPRYTQFPQRPVFYYPQGHAEVENATAYKGIGRELAQDPSSAPNKQNPANPPGLCLAPQPVLRDFPPPGPMAAANNPFHRHCELSPFQVYRAHLLAGQKRTFAKGPGALQLAPHADRPVDYSSQGVQVTSPPDEACGRTVSPGAFHPVQPHSSYRSSDYMSVANCKMQAGLRSEDMHTTPKDGIPHGVLGHHQRGAGPLTGLSSTEHPSSLCVEVAASRKHQANGPDNPPAIELPSLRQMERSDDLSKVEVPGKLQEKVGLDHQQIEGLRSPLSPPMPIINKVFSLAPYKAYLEASGMLSLQKGLQNGEMCSNYNHAKPDTQSHVKDQKQNYDEPSHRLTPADCTQSSDVKDVKVNTVEPQKVKMEKTTLGDLHCCLNPDEKKHEAGHQVPKGTVVKEEEANEVSSSSDSVLDLSVKKAEFDMSASEIKTTTNILTSSEYQADTSVRHGTMDGLTLNISREHPARVPTPPKPPTPTLRTPETKVFFQQVPPQCLKMSPFKVILPDVLRPPLSSVPRFPLVMPEPKSTDTSRLARHRFMEMHQSLFRLISSSVSSSSEQELRAWLAKWQPHEPVSPPAKAPRVSGLLAAGAREAWLRCGDTSSMLAQIISRLEDFASNRQCPFPHVIRAGAVFIPMLVVKENLFPQVPGSLIDQVLQEHHLELRPTTLSEERHLTQLQRRACSSKMRKLLSLKHLPNIYPDLLNLFYHTCVSKRLDSTSPAGAQKTAQI